MKPVVFKNEHELLSFINRLPVSDRKVKVPGMFEGEPAECSEIVSKLKALAPRMFELRAIIVKGMGGLGNYRSLERFVDIASENIVTEHVATYIRELEEINTEVGTLVEGGLNEDIAQQLMSAKSKVAALNQIRSTVMDFDLRLQALVTRLNGKYEELITSLQAVKKTQKTTEAKAAMSTAILEFKKVQDSVVSLGEDLHSYCLLQVAYNSAVMS